MENFKISVVVPVYNVENYLEESVKSLTAQTYENLEIILVDDGSKDRSGEICDRLAGQDDRIRVIHQENGGLVLAWTVGVKQATGEYLSFMDSDDWVDLEMLEKMAACLRGNGKEIVSCDYVMEKGEGDKRDSQAMYQRLLPGEYTREYLRENICPKILGEEERFLFFSRCMKLFSKELILDNLDFCDKRIRMGEDGLIVIPALLDCERLVVLDRKAYYHYRYVGSSMVHGYDAHMMQNMRWLKEGYERIVANKYPEQEQEKMQRRVQMEYQHMLLLVLKNEARGNPKGYRKNIKTICRSSEVRKLVKSTAIQVKETSNRLLYGVLKHPNWWMLTLLRAAMIWYYRR